MEPPSAVLRLSRADADRFRHCRVASVSVEARNTGIFSYFSRGTRLCADMCSADWLTPKSATPSSGPTSASDSGLTALATRPTASRGRVLPRPVHSLAH